MTEETGERLDPALIDKLIAYLANPEDQDRVWAGLHFMETNGLDLSLRSEELHGYLIDDQRSPIENSMSLSLAREREIVLALRDVVRRDLGLPPLTPEERRTWNYEPAAYPARCDADSPDRYRGTPEEREAMRGFIAQAEPEVLRAMKLQDEDAVRLGERFDEMQSNLWLRPRLGKLIRAYRPDLPPLDAHNFATDLLEDSWREAGGAPHSYSPLYLD